MMIWYLAAVRRFNNCEQGVEIGGMSRSFAARRPDFAGVSVGRGARVVGFAGRRAELARVSVDSLRPGI